MRLGIQTVKNKLGLDCEYTQELAQDLYAVHGLDVVRVFAELNATKFNISKEVIKRFGNIYLKFTLATDHPDDEPFIWTVQEKPLMTLY